MINEDNCLPCSNHMRAKIIVSLKYEAPYHDDAKISKMLNIEEEELQEWSKLHYDYIDYYLSRKNIIGVDNRMIDQRLIQMEKLVEGIQKIVYDQKFDKIMKRSNEIIAKAEEKLYLRLNNLFAEGVITRNYEQNKQLDRIETSVFQTKNFLENNFVFEDEEVLDD